MTYEHSRLVSVNLYVIVGILIALIVDIGVVIAVADGGMWAAVGLDDASLVVAEPVTHHIVLVGVEIEYHGRGFSVRSLAPVEHHLYVVGDSCGGIVVKVFMSATV